MSDEEEVFPDPFLKDTDISSIASSHTVWEESDLNVDLSLDDSFRTNISERTSQVGTPKKTSTPSKKPVPKAGSSAIFKKPEPPNARMCTVCRRILKTHRGFETHMNTHKWKEAASRKPPLEDILSHCASKVKDILEELAQTGSPEIKCVIVEVLQNYSTEECDKFVNALLTVISSGLKKSLIAMPSSVRGDLQQSVSDCISSKSFQSSLLESFPVKCSLDVFSLLVYDLLKSLVDAAVIFLCKSMRKVTETSATLGIPRSNDDFDHHLTHQVVHYIAGSALRKQVRDAQRHPHNEKLKRMKECILAKFARIGSPPIVDQKDKNYWTHLLNRKSLLFV